MRDEWRVEWTNTCLNSNQIDISQMVKENQFKSTYLNLYDVRCWQRSFISSLSCTTFSHFLSVMLNVHNLESYCIFHSTTSMEYCPSSRNILSTSVRTPCLYMLKHTDNSSRHVVLRPRTTLLHVRYHFELEIISF